MNALPIIMLSIILLSGCAYFIYQNIYLPKKNINDTDDDENINRKSAWEFTNVRDIGENAIFTTDNKVITCYRITPINIDLMTDEEKEIAINMITAGVSAIREPYKILSIQKPYDIAPYISDLMRKYKETDDEIRKRIIMKEISALNELGSKNDIKDRQCFLIYWTDKKKYDKKRTAFAKCWDEGKVILEMLTTKDLIRLCNLVYNPSTSTEVDDISPTIPILKY